jgi:hypothetical protein
VQQKRQLSDAMKKFNKGQLRTKTKIIAPTMRIKPVKSSDNIQASEKSCVFVIE